MSALVVSLEQYCASRASLNETYSSGRIPQLLTGEIRDQINRIWDAFWSGGIANPLEVIEQITCLLLLRRLDDPQALEESKATKLGKPIERQILGLFIRSLVGMDREAAKQAFGAFLTGRTPTQPDRVRQRDRRSPDGAWRHGSRLSLGVPLHRHQPARAGGRI